MLAKLRAKLTYANVVSSLCLFLVVSGGTAYAVTQIDRNSVKSKHIVDGQVKSVDVADDSLTGGGLSGSDIAPDALTGEDVDESKLRVPTDYTHNPPPPEACNEPSERGSIRTEADSGDGAAVLWFCELYAGEFVGGFDWYPISVGTTP